MSRSSIPEKPKPKPQAKTSLWQSIKKWWKTPLGIKYVKNGRPEYDVTYGEDTWEQEDDEFHEEVW